MTNRKRLKPKRLRSRYEREQEREIERGKRAALQALPRGLSILGFEAALMVNFQIQPGRNRLDQLFKEYRALKLGAKGRKA